MAQPEKVREQPNGKGSETEVVEHDQPSCGPSSCAVSMSDVMHDLNASVRRATTPGVRRRDLLTTSPAAPRPNHQQLTSLQTTVEAFVASVGSMVAQTAFDGTCSDPRGVVFEHGDHGPNLELDCKPGDGARNKGREGRSDCPSRAVSLQSRPASSFDLTVRTTDDDESIQESELGLEVPYESYKRDEWTDEWTDAPKSSERPPAKHWLLFSCAACTIVIIGGLIGGLVTARFSGGAAAPGVSSLSQETMATPSNDGHETQVYEGAPEGSSQPWYEGTTEDSNQQMYESTPENSNQPWYEGTAENSNQPMYEDKTETSNQPWWEGTTETSNQPWWEGTTETSNELLYEDTAENSNQPLNEGTPENSNQEEVYALENGPAASSASAKGWELVPGILARIETPSFPNVDFDITQYGAVGDGDTDSTDAFRRAIEACSSAGGGRVVVPDGTYLTGAIHLKSGVNLFVSASATVRFDRKPSSYLPLVRSRWEGVELMNYSPLIYAFNQTNIAITGSGVLDGRADGSNWWPWKMDGLEREARSRLFEMGEMGMPVGQRTFGEGHYLRPSFVQPFLCRNALIEGVTIRDSPMWVIHPVFSTSVTVRGVQVISHGPNNDGCNPDSSTDVLIEESVFDSGDDCVAIKSGRNADGRRRNIASSGIVIRNCEMIEGHGGLVFGSETSGGINNVFAEDCRFDSPNLDHGLRIKTNSVRGGIIESIFLRNIKINEVSKAAIWVNFLYEEGDAGPYNPTLRNVEVSALTSYKSKYAFYLVGLHNAPILNTRLEKCTFNGVERGSVLEHVQSIELDDVSINGQPVQNSTYLR